MRHPVRHHRHGQPPEPLRSTAAEYHLIKILIYADINNEVGRDHRRVGRECKIEPDVHVTLQDLVSSIQNLCTIVQKGFPGPFCSVLEGSLQIARTWMLLLKILLMSRVISSQHGCVRRKIQMLWS